MHNADYSFTTEDMRINTTAKYHVARWLSLEALFQYEHQTTTVNNLQNGQMYYVRNLINEFAWDDGSGTRQFTIPKGSILDHSISSMVSHSGRIQMNAAKQWHANNEINVLAGFEIKQAKVSGIGSRLYGYNDDLANSVPVDYVSQFPVNPYGYSQQIPSFTSVTGLIDRSVSYFANAAYTYRNRYILSGSARKDESNLFGVNANQKGVP